VSGDEGLVQCWARPRSDLSVDGSGQYGSEGQWID
jgi:hypothetical protein